MIRDNNIRCRTPNSRILAEASTSRELHRRGRGSPLELKPNRKDCKQSPSSQSGIQNPARCTGCSRWLHIITAAGYSTHNRLSFLDVSLHKTTLSRESKRETTAVARTKNTSSNLKHVTTTPNTHPPMHLEVAHYPPHASVGTRSTYKHKTQGTRQQAPKFRRILGVP